MTALPWAYSGFPNSNSRPTFQQWTLWAHQIAGASPLPDPPGEARGSGPDDAARHPIQRKLRVLDLFSGIGGFSLGLERTSGFETVAFCEIEDFPRRVLAKHWPNVPCYRDVRELTAERLAADGLGTIDVITGGFPCQDISTAGKGAGLAGERSGLWSEIARLVGELAPRFVIVENVAALLGRGLGDVLGDLASLGYDAEWHCIPASAVGAPHRRDRIWIVAHTTFMQRNGCDNNAAISMGGKVPQPGNNGWPQFVADAMLNNEQGIVASFANPQEWARQVERSAGPCGDGFGGWAIEPNVGRVANGVPDRAHRLKALGNAVVPQIPELIGRAILAALDETALAGVDADGATGGGAIPVSPAADHFAMSSPVSNGGVRLHDQGDSA